MSSVIAPPLAMTDEQRAALEVTARSTTLGHRKVVQAKALLLAADGVGTNEVARRCHTSNESVRSWRRRFEAEGVEGVGRIALGRGRKSWLPEGTVAAVVHNTLHATPDDGSTHWTTRLMATRFGIGKDSVARIWRDHNLKPWKVDTFKVSNDPYFEEKLVDVVGLYLNPPERAVVFSFDEKTPGPGSLPHAAVAPHEEGTGDDADARLQAARDARSVRRHARGHRRGPLRHQEVPQGDRRSHLLQVHRPARAERPRGPRRARQPPCPQGPAHRRLVGRPEAGTMASALHADKLVVAQPRRALVQRVDGASPPTRRVHLGAQLIEAIELWAEHWNDDPKPFVWHKQANETIAKVKRGRASLTQVNSATDHLDPTMLRSNSHRRCWKSENRVMQWMFPTRTVGNQRASRLR